MKEAPCICEVTAFGNVDNPKCEYHHPELVPGQRITFDEDEDIVPVDTKNHKIDGIVYLPLSDSNPIQKLIDSGKIKQASVPKMQGIDRFIGKNCEWCDGILDTLHPKREIARVSFFASHFALAAAPDSTLMMEQVAMKAKQEVLANAAMYGWTPDGVHPATLSKLNKADSSTDGESWEWVLDFWVAK
jgi:hypothetical protein